MKKRMLSLLLCLVLPLTACGTREQADSGDAFPLEQTVNCTDNYGASTPFEIQKSGAVSLTLTNDTSEDIVVTIHKQGILGQWGKAVELDGETEILVPANGNAVCGSDGSKLSRGSYRCEGANETGIDFDYTCIVQELEYAP